MKKKAKEIDWKKLVSTKAFLTVGSVMLICVAVLVSSLVGPVTDPAVEGEQDGVLGNTVLTDSTQSVSPEQDVGAAAPETDDFFAMAIINRTQVRDSALEVLNEIATNPDTLPDAKEDALSSIANIADDMTAEANIETLVKAKGIAECVAVISGDGCSVVVNTAGLTADELTQITDIVYEQTGISTKNITVVEAKA